MSRLVTEIDENLPGLGPDQSAHSIALIESSCSYLRNCVKENFRINPVFTMPLARRVASPEGIVIDGEHIRTGVSLLFLAGLRAVLTAYPYRHLSLFAIMHSITTLQYGVLTITSSSLLAGMNLLPMRAHGC